MILYLDSSALVTLATFDRPLWEAAAGMGLAVLPEML